MVVLPQWNADAESHVGLCRMLAERGITAARLTLPYHEERSPHESIRADMAVSANIGRTLRVSQQAVSDVRRARAWLQQQGHDRIGIVGTSLGSCIGFLALAQEPAFNVGVLHHVSSYFGDVVWRGISTRHVRSELQAHCSQAAVRRFWAPISPIHFVGRVSRQTHTLLLSGRYDLTFPYDLSQGFHRAFRQHGLPHRVIVVPWGHYTSGVFPFNAITVRRVLRYLDQHL
jgi:dienelactone hydrolase